MNDYLKLLDEIIKSNNEKFKKEQQLAINLLDIVYLAAVDDVLCVIKPILTNLYQKIDELEVKLAQSSDKKQI